MNAVAAGIGGLIAAGGAYLAFIQKKKTEGMLTELKFIKSTPLAELHDAWKSLNDQGLGEGFRDLVETRGTAGADGDETAPYSNQKCAYYEASVTREYEKTERRTDKDGKTTTHRTRGSEVVSSNTSASPIFVADGEHKVGLDLSGAEIQMKDGADKFEPYMDDKTYTFFGIRFTDTAGARTIGFRYKEKLIPVGHPLYVVGEARHSGGEIRIGKPGDKSKPFIVSVKSKEEVTAGVEGKAKMQFYAGLGLIVLGVAIALLIK